MSAGWRLAAALLALLLPAAGQAAAGDERLSLASRDHALNQNGAATELRAILRKPDGPGPFPALVLLHGCGGLLTRSGKIDARFDEWASRFRDLGYLSLLLDSFNPRGEREICTKAKRPILPSRERPLDAYAALLFL